MTYETCCSLCDGLCSYFEIERFSEGSTLNEIQVQVQNILTLLMDVNERLNTLESA